MHQLSAIFLACLFLAGSLMVGRTQTTNLQLRLEQSTNAIDMVVDGVAPFGAFFIYQTDKLEALSANPTLVLQTNTALTNGVRFGLPVPRASPSQGFFSVSHWPGRVVEEFGEPENYPDIPAPAMVLFTSGAPAPLADSQASTVDFFITDPIGQLLDVTGAVSILVFRESDCAVHPDAMVSPQAGQMTNGHLRIAITIHSASSLDGYRLGLGPAPVGLPPFQGLTQYLKSSFNIGPSPLPSPTAQALLQALDQRRMDNADAGPSWSYPLQGSGHPVSGTFGEWRGRNNYEAHRGLDLAAGAATSVIASRGGVVSQHGTLPDMGDYLVIDHGGGWFSRYLHLDPAQLSVVLGQAVARGSALATRLYAGGNWAAHLHFEIRRGANQAQWGVAVPGVAQDPLQTPGIFSVPPNTTLPELREFGLTRQHPGQNAFVRTPPTADVPGPVYLFTKFFDVEAGRRLGLRAMRFHPEGLAVPVEIRPTNDMVITTFLPPGVGVDRGFARYDGHHAANPDPASYFRYWWQWDTSSYVSDRKGPRLLVLTGEDHTPGTSGFPFIFGPQIKSNSLTQIAPRQYQFTNIAFLGTNTPAALSNATLFVQPDQYKLEIIQTNGQPLGGVTWSGPMAGGYTRLFTAHIDEETYTFTLPGSITLDGLKLRVSSRLVPEISHELCLCGGTDMALIPAGQFVMGGVPNDFPGSSDQPVHTVQLSAFYMDKYPVKKTVWDEVYQWAITNGYGFAYDASGKASNHPAQSMTWHDAAKWCNARSEKEGRTPAYYTNAAQTAVYRNGEVTLDSSWVNWNLGYRLPTEAEWEKAARGGVSGYRFPWSDVNTISHTQANYYSSSYTFDLSPTQGFHPSFQSGGFPYTSPVGYFAPNGYGLYDMAGNVWSWCWDWYGGYSSSSQTDPRGAISGVFRVVRGGSWGHGAASCRSAGRSFASPTDKGDNIGFRCVLP